MFCSDRVYSKVISGSWRKYSLIITCLCIIILYLIVYHVVMFGGLWKLLFGIIFVLVPVPYLYMGYFRKPYVKEIGTIIRIQDGRYYLKSGDGVVYSVFGSMDTSIKVGDIAMYISYSISECYIVVI